MRWLAATISLKVSAILPEQSDLVAGHAHGEIADPHGLQRMQQLVQLGRAAVDEVVGGVGWNCAGSGGFALEVDNRFRLRLHELGSPVGAPDGNVRFGG